jgi:hypothetical protein
MRRVCRFAQPSNNSAKICLYESRRSRKAGLFTIAPLIELLHLGIFFISGTLMQRESFNGSRSAKTAS